MNTHATNLLTQLIDGLYKATPINQMTQHTPSPWIFPSKYATHIVDSSSRMIIYVPKPNWMTDEEHQANKSLIYAAPDLLEALETLNLVVGLTPIAGNKDALQEACDIARAAIAKAKQITK